jgi:hypothetical protein
MEELQLSEVQLDELWAFVKKRRLMTRGGSGKAKEKPGSGPP